jgi:gamma-glutamyltranspeptidase/glutathione hydrolase
MSLSKLTGLLFLVAIFGSCSSAVKKPSPLLAQDNLRQKIPTHYWSSSLLEGAEQSRPKKNAVAIATQGNQTSQAAKWVLENGGNIVDAAVAASFAISVERPHSTGLGGGGFLLVYLKGMKEPVAFDFREMAPTSAHEKMFLDQKGEVINDKSLIGPYAIGVPGLVAGVLEVHARYGNMPLAQVLSPAIKLAREGFLIYPELARAIEETAISLKKFKENYGLFLDRQGRPLKLGQRLQQPDLAKTLELIAAQGSDGFYKGPVAQAIVSTIKHYGAKMTLLDLEEYRVRQRAPVSGKFNGHTIYSMPPPSSGGIHVIQILKILQNEGLSSGSPLEARNIHWLASAMQAAFADRAAFLGDSDFVEVPKEGLVSDSYIESLKDTISEDHFMPQLERKAGNPYPHEPDHTTHLTLMDQEGNVVVSTQTINGWFGSAMVAKGTGVVLNNEMDDFATKVGATNLFGAVGGEKNLVAPLKRPLSSMSPTLVLDGKKPILALGTPSGTRILTCVAQTILNVLEYQMPLFDAVASNRFHHQWHPDYLWTERELPPEVQTQLLSKGHKIEVKDLGCRIQATQLEDGVLEAVSDPRGEGSAVGLIY